ncbi:hypothetical protein GCM10027347_61640 [Larkinella harenae]
MSNAVPYRRMAEKVVRQVISNNSSDRLPELRRKIRNAYPFGYPEGYALMVWNYEVSAQLATRKRPYNRVNCSIKK